MKTRAIRLAVASAATLLLALALSGAMAQAAQLHTAETTPPVARLAPVTSTDAYTLFVSALFGGPSPALCPPITGWRGEYWAGTEISETPTLCRNDANLSFDWGQGSPDPSIPADHFAARWTREVELAAGHYRFNLAGDDGVRLWVDGALVIDEWRIQARAGYVAELDLGSGPHNLKVEYFEDSGLASVSLSWEGPLAGCAAYRAEYFANQTLAGEPAFVQCENDPLSHDWGTGGPGHGLPAEHFSVRWTRRAHFEAGAYSFIARTDDGMRVWLGNDQILNSWRAQGATEYRAARNLGAGDYDIKIEYYQDTGAAVAQFRWEHRTLPAGITISQKQGMDACAPPSLADMQTWWDNSPYWEYNLYIGGSMRGCDAANRARLTPDWLRGAHAQGWNFIPTWVGPQAPCTDFRARLSSDPGVAYEQGRSEGDAAAAAARALGLNDLAGAGSSTIIYYDMEAYTGDAACRNAVKSFMSGWTARLHELGVHAGAYGSPCSGYMSDWATAGNVLDDIWAAVWTSSGYNANASVWGLACLSDGLWNNHQRIHQYAGGHNETWGGVTVNIDSNVVDGHVAGDNSRPITETRPAPADPAATGAPAVGDSPALDAQLLPSGQGWARAGERLLWTDDAGNVWRDVTPQVAGLSSVRAAAYTDAAHGWALLAGNAGDTARLVLARTSDGGATWDTTGLALPSPDPGLATSAAQLQFVDSRHGWLVLRLPSSSSFSRAALYATADGGRSWQPLSLPGGGAVRFTDAVTGWSVGGAGGDELYVTRDGGRRWTPQPVAGPVPSSVSIRYGLPSFTDAAAGLLPVTVAGGTEAHVRLYRTTDGGRSWQPSGEVGLAGEQPGSALPFATTAGGGWRLADPRTGASFAGGAAGQARPGAASTSALKGVINLQFAGENLGWAQVQQGECRGQKGAGALRCAARSILLRTTDGGRTWAPALP